MEEQKVNHDQAQKLIQQHASTQIRLIRENENLTEYEKISAMAAVEINKNLCMLRADLGKYFGDSKITWEESS